MSSITNFIKYNKTKSLGLFLLFSSLGLVFTPKAHAQAAGAGGCYIVGGFTAIYTYSTTSPMGGCASEATLSNQFTYLSTGRNMSLTGAVGGAAGLNDGVIELLRKLNDNLSKNNEGNRQAMPNADMAARVRETDMAMRKAIAKYSKPISQQACRQATVSRGLGSGGYGGSPGSGGPTTNSDQKLHQLTEDTQKEVLTPEDDLNYLGKLTFSKHSKQYCTAADIANDMPGCIGLSAPGKLAGANVDPTSILKSAVPEGSDDFRSFAIKFPSKPGADDGSDAYYALRNYIRMVRPFPGPDVSKTSKGTPETKEYLVYQRRYNSRVLAVTGALDRIASESAMLDKNSPFVKNVWEKDDNLKKEFHEIYGENAKMPERPSERGLLNFMVMRQFTSEQESDDMDLSDSSDYYQRQIQLSKLRAYLLLKLNDKMNWNNILLANILSNSVDPVNRKELVSKSNSASSQGGYSVGGKSKSEKTKK